MWLYNIAVFIIRPIVLLLFRVRCNGHANIPKDGGVILACNHRHAIDPAIVAVSTLRPIRFMAKTELFRNKISGFFLKLLGAFPIKRGKADTTGIHAAEEILNNGEMLLVFPEGTRSKTGALQPLKSGAAMLSSHTGCPVIPVWIETRKGGLRPFKRTYVTYGEPITTNMLYENERHTTKDNHRATEIIRGKMLELAGKYIET